MAHISVPARIPGEGPKLPEALYEQYLGSIKDNVRALSVCAASIELAAPLGYDRFKAYLAIRRLGELPKERSKKALPMILSSVGYRYKPWNPPGVSLSRRESYPVDDLVIKIGKAATPYIIDHIRYMHITKPALIRDRIAALVDVLDAIEGPANAEKLLFAKFYSYPPELERSQKHLKMAIAIALVRVRKGLEMHAETPTEKYEQELQRVQEEIKLRERPDQDIVPDEAKGEPELKEKPAPPLFPWYLIIIGAVVVIGAIAAVSIIFFRRKR